MLYIGGLYALPARHEWVKQNERLTNEQYQKYSTISIPIYTTQENGPGWQKAAGMKYAFSPVNIMRVFACLIQRY